MHSWCSSYLEKRPLGKFGRDETKFKLPLHHLFLILQVHIILGAALDLKWGGLGDLCTWGKNKESELPPNFIIVCLLIEGVSPWKILRAFNCFCFILKKVLREVAKNEYFAVRLTVRLTPPLTVSFSWMFLACPKHRRFLVQNNVLSPFYWVNIFTLAYSQGQEGWPPIPHPLQSVSP